MLRFLSSLCAALISSLRPLTEIEKSISAWPPSAPLGAWLERLLLAPWLRWDAVWYERIVTHGYQAQDGTAQFHPLYPWLSAILVRLGIHPLLSLLIVSSIATILLGFFFLKLAQMQFTDEEARNSLILFLVFPAAFVLFAPYSEALFLLFSVLCFYFARRKAWFWAGIAGGLATLTRQQGIFLVLPLAWEMWESSGRKFQATLKIWKQGLNLLLIPAGWLVWIVYRGLAFSDIRPDYHNLNSWLYSVLISPSADQVVPSQTFMWPWKALWIAIQKLARQPDIDLWANLILGAIFILFLVLAWRYLRNSERIYVVCLTLVSFSYNTGLTHPYMGLPRHLLLAFPVFLAVGAFIRKPILRMLAIAASLIGSLFMMVLFFLETWVP